MRNFTICDKKIQATELSNKFLNISEQISELILLLIKYSCKKWIVDTMGKLCSILSLFSEWKLNFSSLWPSQRRKVVASSCFQNGHMWKWIDYYFSPSLRVVELKLIKLIQFTSPNPLIYFNFLCAVASSASFSIWDNWAHLLIFGTPWYQILQPGTEEREALFSLRCTLVPQGKQSFFSVSS